jgi:SpoVK/Ycf46/Vps4 family AAA+-type ATPase
MKKPDLLSELILAHFNSDAVRFQSLSEQVVATHPSLEQREKIEQAMKPAKLSARVLELTHPVPCVQPHLFLESHIWSELRDIVLEQAHSHLLSARNLVPRSRILFQGLPGNGKTAAAQWLSVELGRPAFLVSLPRVVESFLGSTGQNLNQLFDVLRSNHILILDEIDALGTVRAAHSNEASREESRIVCTLLALLDNVPNGILIATTNRPDMLDTALLRRFHSILHFAPPSSSLASQFVASLCRKHGLSEIVPISSVESFHSIQLAVLRQARRLVLANALQV